MSTENEDGLELGALQPEWAKIQDASTDDFGVPVPAVMEAIIDNFAPAEDRYEHLELIVKTRPDGEAWFDIIHDYITQDCDSVRLEDDEDGFEQWSPCNCGMEMMSGMGGTLQQCFDHSTNLGGGLQPIDVARALVALADSAVVWDVSINKVLKWARNEIDFEAYFENKEWENAEDDDTEV